MKAKQEERPQPGGFVGDDEIVALQSLLHLVAAGMRRREQAGGGTSPSMPWLDLHMLQVIADRGEVEVKALREHFRLPRSSVTSVINRLEERGLIVRRIHPHDRRSYLLAVTAAGQKVQEEHSQRDRQMARSFLLPLSRAERAMLVELLGKVQRAF